VNNSADARNEERLTATKQRESEYEKASQKPQALKDLRHHRYTFELCHEFIYLTNPSIAFAANII
jgi:hypothetical protein